jgi:uncharacterized membrane protein SirB2
MSTQTLYNLALVTHILGLTLMAGTTLVDFILTRQFWKQLANDRQKGLGINDATIGFPALFGAGILLLIASGITMMAITHGAYGEQIWFRIKFVFILLIIINGVAVGRRQGSALRRNLKEENNEVSLAKIKTNLNIFHLSQLAMFITVFVLSVFKFN